VQRIQSWFRGFDEFEPVMWFVTMLGRSGRILWVVLHRQRRELAA
jgi:hypothetical protein